MHRNCESVPSLHFRSLSDAFRYSTGIGISMRQVAGVILIGFAFVKAIGLIVVLMYGDGDRPAHWFVKQTVYAVGAASAGWSLLRTKKA